MTLSDIMAKAKTASSEQAKKTACGVCPKCGQQMDDAGWGYCRCMNAECGDMGKKVKA